MSIRIQLFSYFVLKQYAPLMDNVIGIMKEAFHQFTCGKMIMKVS